MCGIFGYLRSGKTGQTLSPVDICLKGLSFLEYRGYDSAGIAGLHNGKLKSCKRTGKVKRLKDAVKLEKLTLDLAIAHTRWATHGSVNEENAHPHFDEKKTVAVVHNGIIENHFLIRNELEKKGVTFESDTDSEVIAQLIAYVYSGDLYLSVKKVLTKLQGSLAIAVVHVNHPNQIVAASRESPLVLGIDHKKKEIYLSSDIASLEGKLLDIVYLRNDEIAILQNNHMKIFNKMGQKIFKEAKKIGLKKTTFSKNGFEHFMLKEIFDQPQTIKQAQYGRIQDEFGTAIFDEIYLSAQELQSTERLLILGCGTSFHAGCIGASMLEGIARIPTEVQIASEFRYTNPIISKDTLVLAISQSGETADTIAAVREAKAKGAKVISICNASHSTLVRESTNTLFLNAGLEISVCSTKAFTSQLTVLALFTLFMARLRHFSKEEGQKFIKKLTHLPGIVSQILSQIETMERLAMKYATFNHFFFLGRLFMYPTSLEAALKLKEISYLNASGYPAGEMKHGPLALVDSNVAIIAMCGNLKTMDKMFSNLMEVKARKGRILAFAPKGTKEIEKITEDVFYLPQVIDPLASIPYSVAAQLFAYFVAKIRGTEIDQPRNLAKSVTVE